MKRLYILRHAKSSWAQPGLTDKERPLNARGEKQLVVLNRWFDHNLPKPEKVVCSPAIRTQQTLAGIESALNNPDIEIVAPLYNGMLETYLSCLWEQTSDSVLLIGHNPTCDELSRYLAKPSSPAASKIMSQHFGTGTIACFDFDGDDWSGLGESSCSLVSFLRPKELETSEPL